MAEWGSQWGSQWGCGTGIPSKVEDICKRWLWWQYDNAPNMRTLCAIFTTLFSEQESKLQDVLQTRGLNGASGGELDSWGVMVGVSRDGVSDILMRRKIQAAARTALSQGQPRDFYDVMTLIAPDSNPRYAEVYPACVRLFFEAVDNDTKRIIFELLRDIPGAAICLQYVEVDESGQVFEFSYLESDVGVMPRQTFGVQWHWDFFPDKDIPPNQKAGFAFLIE
jgi:hypothetical protein